MNWVFLWREGLTDNVEYLYSRLQEGVAAVVILRVTQFGFYDITDPKWSSIRDFYSLYQE